jgi:hypothetical protein
MARIDDDRQSQRANERLIKEMRQKEARTQDKANADNAFQKLLQGAQTTRQADARARAAQARAGDDSEALSFEKLLQEATQQSTEEGQTAQTRGSARDGQRAQSEGLRRGDAKTSDKGLERKGDDESTASFQDGVKGQDRGTGEVKSQGRAADARDSRKGLSEKGEDIQQGALAGRAGAKGGGALKTDGDGGGKGGGQGGKDSQGGNPGGVPAGFRFNPALMAPVPVAKAAPGGSERLRAIANEIAQKIVERVRVGTNAAGNSEFQIDLRSNVLKGLSIKVSSGNGKIRASFSGSDKEILRLLRENAETLKAALGGRGLTLEDLQIEERA